MSRKNVKSEGIIPSSDSYQNIDRVQNKWWTINPTKKLNKRGEKELLSYIKVNLVFNPKNEKDVKFASMFKKSD